jgi:AcrR family transcriptional regulator
VANDRAIPRLSRAEAKAETRRRLLEAAEAVFRREGYHRASLDRIAAEAGFTTGAVYSTFDSKADVMLALLAARDERRRVAWTEVLDNASNVEDFVAEVARRYAREIAAERDWLVVANEFMIVIGRDEELRTRYTALHETGLAALTASISTWVQRLGESLTIAPRRLATVVAALNRGLVLEGLVARLPRCRRS